MTGLRTACFRAAVFPAAEASWPPAAEIVPAPAGDNFAYWRELTARWDGRSDLAVIEGDIEIHPGAVSQLAACPSPWCTFPYLAHSWGNPRPDVAGNAARAAAAGALCESLGCARFTAALQQAVPLPARPVPYWICDGTVAAALRAAGYAPCLHEPWVTNHRWTATR